VLGVTFVSIRHDGCLLAKCEDVAMPHTNPSKQHLHCHATIPLEP
jgi:hypothetical protein